MKLFFASHNENKIREISAMLPANMMLKSLKDLSLTEEIVENGLTLEENALLKARFLHAHIHHASFADDSGLEVEVLNGRPGVYSARYAGPEKNDAANSRKLLRELEGKNNRSAVFKTVIAFVDGQQEFLFSGEVRGNIALTPRGTNGFGYDPIFVPEGWSESFAEVEKEIKNLHNKSKKYAKLKHTHRRTGALAQISLLEDILSNSKEKIYKYSMITFVIINFVTLYFLYDYLTEKTGMFQGLGLFFDFVRLIIFSVGLGIFLLICRFYFYIRKKTNRRISIYPRCFY